jgi:hypothetical protein
MLEIGYNCCYYHLSSFPASFECIDGVVVGFSDNKSTYFIKDAKDSDIVYKDIPYIYVSSGRERRTWNDYYKIGVRVMVTASSLSKTEKRPAYITDIRQVKGEDYYEIDVKDAVTGFVAYCVPPRNFFLDVKYYKDW